MNVPREIRSKRDHLAARLAGRTIDKIRLASEPAKIRIGQMILIRSLGPRLLRIARTFATGWRMGYHPPRHELK
jgi:hypothetical protein